MTTKLDEILIKKLLEPHNITVYFNDEYLSCPPIPLFMTEYVLKHISNVEQIKNIVVNNMLGESLFESKDPNAVIDFLIRNKSPEPEDWNK